MISAKPVRRNAHPSIRNNLDPDSNRTEKQRSLRISTDRGIMISIKAVPLKTDFSISDNFDSDSNVTEESDLHLEKHDSLKISIEPGMKMDLRSLFENKDISIRDNLDPFSIRIDLIRGVEEIDSKARDSSPEGSQSLKHKKVSGEIEKTDRITPSWTINRGQNSELTFHIV
jgi:hypothetical protein